MQEHEVRELFERLRDGHGPGDGVPGAPRGLHGGVPPVAASGWTATACAGSRRPSRAARPPEIQLLRVTGSGDVWFAESVIHYPDGTVFHGVSRIEFRDGKIWRETRYYAEPFEVPEWRAGWSKPVIEEPVAG